MKFNFLNKKSKVQVRQVYMPINSVIVPFTDRYEASDSSDVVSPRISADILSST